MHDASCRDEQPRRPRSARATTRGRGPTDAAVAPQRLTYLVKQLQEAMRAQLEHITQQFGLTPKQYTALSVLAKHPGISSAHLARLTFVTPSGRERDGRDPRAQGVPEAFGPAGQQATPGGGVTRAGATALTRCNALVDQLERFVFRDVGRADEAQFRRTLQLCLDR